MLLAPLLGATLVFTIAAEPLDNAGNPTQQSRQQKTAVTDSLVRSATDCIVRAVTADPRYGTKNAALGDLIVDSMPSCVTPVRAMIDAYDHYYGDGSGEAFFMGPYLDVLPKAVVEGTRRQQPVANGN
jgi:hypothetical protein